jgi:hypothetical protein
MHFGKLVFKQNCLGNKLLSSFIEIENKESIYLITPTLRAISNLASEKSLRIQYPCFKIGLKSWSFLKPQIILPVGSFSCL